MFFFIAGIQPKTIYLEEQLRVCSSCGLYQARLKKVNHYLSFFFIPVFRVKNGAPFLECRSCGAVSPESGEVRPGPRENLPCVCRYCGKALASEFRFCPYCGNAL